MKTIFFFLILFIPSIILGQSYFLKNYLFNSKLASISAIDVNDSTIYFLGTRGRAGEFLHLDAGIFDLEGNIKKITYRDSTIGQNGERIFETCNSIVMNEKKQRVVVSRTYDSLGFVFPELFYFDETLKLTNKSSFREVFLKDSLYMHPYPSIVFNNYDRTYYLTTKNKCENQYCASKFGTNSFSSVFKLDSQGVILKRIDLIENGREIFITDLNVRNKDSLILITTNKSIYLPSDYPYYPFNSGVNIYTFDNNLNFRKKISTLTNKYLNTTFSSILFYDDYFILSADTVQQVSRGGNNLYDQYYEKVMLSISYDGKLNWIKKIVPMRIINPYFGFGIYKMIKTSDSTFVYAFSYLDSVDYQPIMNTYNIQMMNINGDLLWKRNIDLRSIINEDEGDLCTFDIQPFKNDLFFAGDLFNATANINKLPIFRFGYLLKTNCLGFIAPPKASFEPIGSVTRTITFRNKSIQAGSFTWDFGDGTPKRTTPEQQDTVSHTFPEGQSIYNVRLIAHGCNGEADTFNYLFDTKTIDLKTLQPQSELIRIYPNPSTSAQPSFIHIGRLDEINNNTLLIISNQLGQVLKTVAIHQKEMDIIVPQELAKGMYRVVLMNGDNRIESRNFVVE